MYWIPPPPPSNVPTIHTSQYRKWKDRAKIQINHSHMPQSLYSLLYICGQLIGIVTPQLKSLFHAVIGLVLCYPLFLVWYRRYLGRSSWKYSSLSLDFSSQNSRITLLKLLTSIFRLEHCQELHPSSPFIITGTWQWLCIDCSESSSLADRPWHEAYKHGGAGGCDGTRCRGPAIGPPENTIVIVTVVHLDIGRGAVDSHDLQM